MLKGAQIDQAQLAELAGVSLSTVTAWETGKQRPWGDNLERLASALEWTTQQITGESEEQGATVREPTPRYRTNGHSRRCELAEAIRRVEKLPIPEWEKTLRIDAVAAAYRAVAADSAERARERAERAAEARAAALAADARAGEARAGREEPPTPPGIEGV